MVDKGHTGTTGQVTLTTDEGTTDHGDSEKSAGVGGLGRGRTDKDEGEGGWTRMRAREDGQG